ncbi:hypothetical protein ABZP36_014429 [Zizania latifolia]
MGPEASSQWMVSERHSRGISSSLEERSSGEEMVAQIRSVGMEVCEAFMGLHGEGLVLGCLGPWPGLLLPRSLWALPARLESGFGLVPGSPGRGMLVQTQGFHGS